jgi:repressor LexA
MADPLTDRQQEILSFIKRAIQEQGYPPTIREIGEAFGIRSTNGVNDHLKALERKGYLLRGELKSRALHVIEGGQGAANRFGASRSSVAGSVPGQAGGAASSGQLRRLPALAPIPDSEVVEVPVVGKVAAGAPILAEENITDHVRIDSFLLGGGANARKVFGLRVSGDSMIGDGIFDGDYIFVRKQIQAMPGEIVVALIEDEATVKRFYPEEDRIRLQPSNPRLQPIYIRREDFRETSILGVVVGV